MCPVCVSDTMWLHLFLPHLRWREQFSSKSAVFAAVLHLRARFSGKSAALPRWQQSDGISAALRAGSNDRSISAALHPPARSFRPAFCSAAETAQEDALFSLTLRRLQTSSCICFRSAPRRGTHLRRVLPFKLHGSRGCSQQACMLAA